MNVPRRFLSRKWFCTPVLAAAMISVSAPALAETVVVEPATSTRTGWSPLQLDMLFFKLVSSSTPIRGLALGLIGVEGDDARGITLATFYTGYTRQDGVAASIFMNRSTEGVATAQLAGLANSAGDRAGVLQGALLSNKGGQWGVRAVGVSNRSYTHFCGVSLAGIRNIDRGGGLSGLNLAGFSNYARDSGTTTTDGDRAATASHTGEAGRGILLAGIANTSTADGGHSGIIASIITNRVSNTTRGAMVGVHNKTGTLRGMQIGLINRADSARGVQLGLLNYRGGKLRWPLINVSL